MDIEILNNRYTRLVAIEFDDTSKKWKCQCDCGNICYVSKGHLKANNIKSCGCLKQELKQDLINKTFGKLKVLNKDIIKQGRKTYWNCLCSCGIIKSIRGDGLINGMVKSCGCYNKECCLKYVNLTGKTFNYWTVISHNEVYKCLCKCNCGKEKIVKSSSLVSGKSKSCGCFRDNVAKELLIKRHRNLKIERGLDPDIILSTERELERHRILPLLKATKQRDNYTCQLCNITNCNIASHHIEKVSDNIKLFEEETNIITLCIECHNKVHKYNFHGPTDEKITDILKLKILEIYAIK